MTSSATKRTVQPRRPAPRPVTITLDRVRLSSRYALWLGDPEVNRYLTTREMPTVAQLTDYIHRASADSIFRGIYKGKRHIGNIRARLEGSSAAVIGILIGEKDCWGKGYGAESIQLMAELCKEASCDTLLAGMDGEHTASIKAFMRAGFNRDEVMENLRRRAIGDLKPTDILMVRRI